MASLHILTLLVPISLSRQGGEGRKEDDLHGLVLVATRPDQPPVNFLYIRDNRLVTLGADRIVMFDFWSEDCSGRSEFFS